MAKRKKKNTVLGLDLGTSAVKAVEISRVGDEVAVTGCACERVQDPAEYNETIKAVLDGGGFKPNNVVIGFSGRSTMLQTVTLPADAEEDLETAMLSEAEKYIPYDISEAQIDYHVFDNLEGHQIKALLVAVRQQDIEDKLEILFNSGITPVRIDVELVALANAYETANAGGVYLPEGRAAALVDLGATKTLITVTDGVANVFREFPVGGNTMTEMIGQRIGCEMTEAERLKLNPGDRMEIIKDAIYPAIEDITAEIRSCLDTFKSVSAGREPGIMLLSGGIVAFSGLAPLLGRMTKLDTRIFDSFGGIDTSELDKDFLAGHAHEFPIAFGLACHARE